MCIQDSFKDPIGDSYEWVLRDKIIPYWSDATTAVDHNINIIRDHFEGKRDEIFQKYPQRYSEYHKFYLFGSFWYMNALTEICCTHHSFEYNEEQHIPDFLKPYRTYKDFWDDYDLLQIIKDEIMQGKLNYPMLNREVYYSLAKLLVMFKKDFDKAQGKPDGWKFTKIDEERYKNKSTKAWRFEEVCITPKLINHPIQRQDKSKWDARFGVIPIQPNEYDPRGFGFSDDEIKAMFIALKDAYVYDFAYSEYFKDYHREHFDAMYNKIVDEFILADKHNPGETEKLEYNYTTPMFSNGVRNANYNDIILWIHLLIEWDLRSKFQPTIDRYWINGVDTLGVFIIPENAETKAFHSPEELIEHVKSKFAGYSDNAKAIPNEQPQPSDPNEVATSSFHEADDNVTSNSVDDVKPSMALVEQLYKEEMMGTDESLYALCPKAFLANKPTNQEQHNQFVDKYITPIITEYLSVKPYRDAVAKAYHSWVYNIEHDIHYSDKYHIFFKQIDRAPFGNELPDVEMHDFGETLELDDGKSETLHHATYKIKDWCNDNGKWYVLLVTDCYYQTLTHQKLHAK